MLGDMFKDMFRSIFEDISRNVSGDMFEDRCPISRGRVIHHRRRCLE
jgi:hypothetical protein